MKVYRYPSRDSWPSILARPESDVSDLTGDVASIISQVRTGGDLAVLSFTEQFDGIRLKSLKISRKELASAGERIETGLKEAIDIARRNIELFHSSQKSIFPVVQTTEGVKCWTRSEAIEKVGLYIPGGSAPLLSTVLMLGIPAKIAGCSDIILCSPPGKDGRIHPAVLYVADLLGIEKVFAAGGAQAIAAMAYGTESIPRVDKIFGPGNRFVTLAKQLVSIDRVAIDMPAGPSEVAVVADGAADPEFVAVDLLSQAEHGPDSHVVLLTDSGELISKVEKELSRQLMKLPRRDIAEKALANSVIILEKDPDRIIEMVNLYAPEHLIIQTADYARIGEKIKNAGSVFLGSLSPESAGDYASGTNHTLPTNGHARAYSGLGLDSFMKRISFQEISETGLQNIGPAIMKMAEAEQLQAHSNAIMLRLNKLKK